MKGARHLGERLLAACRARGLMVATAESCTGGLVAGAITDLPGSSAALDRGFVTYSNAAKIEMLGVPPETIERFGAVSRETAEAMAAGALRHSRAGLAVAITGIAGPEGGTAEKPAGLVWFATAMPGAPPRAERRVFAGLGRDGVREAAVATALGLMLSRLERPQAADAAP